MVAERTMVNRTSRWPPGLEKPGKYQQDVKRQRHSAVAVYLTYAKALIQQYDGNA